MDRPEMDDLLTCSNDAVLILGEAPHCPTVIKQSVFGFTRLRTAFMECCSLSLVFGISKSQRAL